MSDHTKGSARDEGLSAFWVFLVGVILLWVTAGLVLWFAFPNLEERGQFGDMFGAVNALFSGLAMGGVVFAILLQRRELRLQREELRMQREELQKTAASNVRQLHMRLLELSITHTDLAEVWLHSSDESDARLKQSLYVNLILSHWEMLFCQGAMTHAELEGHLAAHIGKPRFQEFWAKARESRERLSGEKDSLSKTFFETVDEAFRQVAAQQVVPADGPRPAAEPRR
jgi:hypothetical protein